MGIQRCEMETLKTGNVFSDVPKEIPKEIFEDLLSRPPLRLQKIVSAGQSTPPGEWYKSNTDEWVILLSGGAKLFYEGDTNVRNMQPGDYVLIPAHLRHRVEWTHPVENTIWLALHL